MRSDNTEDENDAKCMICHSVFVDNAKIRLTPCGHGLHQKCMDPWLLAGKNRCPSCNMELIHTDKDDDAPLAGDRGD